jgi:hypothetical protein
MARHTFGDSGRPSNAMIHPSSRWSPADRTWRCRPGRGYGLPSLKASALEDWPADHPQARPPHLQQYRVPRASAASGNVCVVGGVLEPAAVGGGWQRPRRRRYGTLNRLAARPVCMPAGGRRDDVLGLRSVRPWRANIGDAVLGGCEGFAMEVVAWASRRQIA